MNFMCTTVVHLIFWFITFFPSISLSCTISYSLMSLMRLCLCLSIPPGFFQIHFLLRLIGYLMNRWCQRWRSLFMFDISLPVSWPGSGSKHGFQKLFIDISPPTGVVQSCLIHRFPYFARDGFEAWLPATI